MSDLRRVLEEARAALARAGVSSARTEAELLAAHVLGTSRGDLAARALRGDLLDPGAVAALERVIESRCARVPLQHLTGRAAFRGIELAVGPGVFVPRPETEVVAGLAIEEAARLAAAGGAPLVVDLCAGSGAIGLSVATEVAAARVLLVELDERACAWARRNLDRAGLNGRVELRQGDVRGGADRVAPDWAGLVDVVVANPPYIPPDAEPVDPEVRDHDPALALYGGGDDGLAVPALVVRAAESLLRRDGLLVMEHAEGQAAPARRLARPPSWRGVRTEADLAGRPRALVARRGSPE